ncbi:MAG: AI-2E family transporter [Patescibacteria group bacterium]
MTIKSPYITKLQFYFLIIALSSAGVFLALVISPFATTLLLSMVLVTGVYPLYARLWRAFGHRSRLSAAVMSFIIAVLFSGPFILFIVLLSQEAVSTYHTVERVLTSDAIDISRGIKWLNVRFGLEQSDITTSLTQAVQGLSGFLVSQSTTLLKSAATLIFNFFLLWFSMFFFFKDGPVLIETAKKMIPLPRRYEDAIFGKFKEVSLAMLYGIFLTALVQGALGGLGLAVFGVKNAVFWGTVMGIFGMLPVGGTAVVWFPAALILFFNGQYGAGVGLLIWGGVIVGLVDNFIKPMLIGREAKIYPLATLLVVLGGLMVFGLKGAILGPMVLVVFLTLIHTYELEGLKTV